MSERLYLYPRFIRFWHIVNAILCLLLILTGVSMQFAGTGGGLVGFKTAVGIHNISGILLSVNYIFFFLGNWFSKNRKFYRFEWSGLFLGLKLQFMYYLIGTFRGQKKPYEITELEKFNPLQKVSYLIIMYVAMPMVILSGWAFLYPEVIPNTIFWFGGLVFVDLFHIVFGFIISIFLLIHIYFSSFGTTPLSNFKSIITGFHE
jgi:thiosulfate reductase cytochrome b subunit